MLKLQIAPKDARHIKAKPNVVSQSSATVRGGASHSFCTRERRAANCQTVERTRNPTPYEQTASSPRPSPPQEEREMSLRMQSNRRRSRPLLHRRRGRGEEAVFSQEGGPWARRPAVN